VVTGYIKKNIGLLKVLEEEVIKAASIKVGVAYKVKTNSGNEFEGTLIFSRDGLLEFVDVNQNYYNARIGKCKITRI